MAGWVYRAYLLSKRGERVFTSNYALTDVDYAIPELRAEAERIAEQRLREIEGVTPDTPIEHVGWMPFSTLWIGEDPGARAAEGDMWLDDTTPWSQRRGKE